MKKSLPRFSVPTPESLAQAALSYLARYAASEGALRHALQNRLRRAASTHSDFAHNAALQKILRNAIETIIERHRKSGVLNDAAYATAKAGSLRREGRSRHYIQQTLGLKGVHADIAKAALKVADQDDTDPTEAEIKAARAFARRRRLGVFRGGAADANRQRKDLGVLARAGFSFDIARKVLEAKVQDENT